MIFRSLKAKDPETGFASLASLETERKKSYGGRGGEYWSRMTLFSFFRFLHALFFRPEQEYSFRATWRAFFFHNSFSFTNIHTHKVNKLSCLMVPPLLGSKEAAGGGGGGACKLFFLSIISDDMSGIHVSWCKFSLLEDFFFFLRGVLKSGRVPANVPVVQFLTESKSVVEQIL